MSDGDIVAQVKCKMALLRVKMKTFVKRMFGAHESFHLHHQQSSPTFYTRTSASIIHRHLHSPNMMTNLGGRWKKCHGLEWGLEKWCGLKNVLEKWCDLKKCTGKVVWPEKVH